MISNSSLLLLFFTSLFWGCLVLTSTSVVSLASFVFLWKYFWNACSILAWFSARSLVMSSSGRLGMIGAGLKNNMSENKCQKCRDSRYPMRWIHTYEFVSSSLSHLSLSTCTYIPSFNIGSGFARMICSGRYCPMIFAVSLALVIPLTWITPTGHGLNSDDESSDSPPPPFIISANRCPVKWAWFLPISVNFLCLSCLDVSSYWPCLSNINTVRIIKKHRSEQDKGMNVRVSFEWFYRVISHTKSDNNVVHVPDENNVPRDSIFLHCFLFPGIPIIIPTRIWPLTMNVMKLVI